MQKLDSTNETKFLNKEEIYKLTLLVICLYIRGI